MDGVEVTTIAERPDLLEASYPLAVEGWADFGRAEAATLSREDWLRDEATLPAGSFVALAGGEVVGYSGLYRRDDHGVAEGRAHCRAPRLAPSGDRADAEDA
jgi:hypothetical protein